MGRDGKGKTGAWGLAVPPYAPAPHQIKYSVQSWVLYEVFLETLEHGLIEKTGLYD